MNIDLNDLIEQEAKERQQQNEAHATLFKSNRKRFITFGTVGTATLAIIVGLAFYNPFTGALPWGDKPEQTPIGATADTNTGAEKRQWFQQEGSRHPIELEKWQTTSHDEHQQATLANKILEAQQSQTIRSEAQVLPSVSSGFTDDASQAFGDNGSRNLLYSLWTQENFTTSTISAIERIINPTFGGWENESRNGDLEAIKAKLSDLFTGDYLEGENALPVITDFTPIEGFTMGDGLPAEGTGWTGVIQNTAVSFAYDQASQNYTATVRASVLYTIWKADKTTVETTGELTLQLVANQEARTQFDRVLISEASLVF